MTSEPNMSATPPEPRCAICNCRAIETPKKYLRMHGDLAFCQKHEDEIDAMLLGSPSGMPYSGDYPQRAEQEIQG